MIPREHDEIMARKEYFCYQQWGWCHMSLVYPHPSWTIEITRHIDDENIIIIHPGESFSISDLWGYDCQHELNYYWRPARFC